MKRFDWDPDKNVQLKKERGVSFEDVIFHLQSGDLLVVMEHPNKKKYGHQRLFVLKINDYVYVVPFVENDTVIFLKTIFLSRRLTKTLLK